MERRSRRTLLSTATGAIALFAGCIGDDLGGGADENGDDDDETAENGNDDADEGSGGDDGDDSNGSDEEDESDDEDADDEASVDEAAFTTGEPRTEPSATLLADREAADDWLADRDVGEDQSDFIEDTSFDDASVVVLEARAPNLCYELRLESATVENGIAIEAVVVDEDDEDLGCAQQEATTGLLVRVSVSGDPVEDGTATIVDHDGAAHEFDLEEDGDTE